MRSTRSVLPPTGVRPEVGPPTLSQLKCTGSNAPLGAAGAGCAGATARSGLGAGVFVGAHHRCVRLCAAASRRIGWRGAGFVADLVGDGVVVGLVCTTAWDVLAVT